MSNKTERPADEILKAIKDNGYYDDFIEMMDKDCFVEAAAVYGKAAYDLYMKASQEMAGDEYK